MTVTINIPDSVSGALTAKLGNLGRVAMECLAAKAYSEGCLGLEGVRKMLDLPSRWEAEALLKQHGVWPGLTVDDLDHDLATLDRVRPTLRC